MALQHIILIFIIELAECLYNLVLAWKVYFFERLLQLRFNFHAV